MYLLKAIGDFKDKMFGGDDVLAEPKKDIPITTHDEAGKPVKEWVSREEAIARGMNIPEIEPSGVGNLVSMFRSWLAGAGAVESTQRDAIAQRVNDLAAGVGMENAAIDGKTIGAHLVNKALGNIDEIVAPAAGVLLMPLVEVKIGSEAADRYEARQALRTQFGGMVNGQKIDITIVDSSEARVPGKDVVKVERNDEGNYKIIQGAKEEVKTGAEIGGYLKELVKLIEAGQALKVTHGAALPVSKKTLEPLIFDTGYTEERTKHFETISGKIGTDAVVDLIGDSLIVLDKTGKSQLLKITISSVDIDTKAPTTVDIISPSGDKKGLEVGGIALNDIIEALVDSVKVGDSLQLKEEERNVNYKLSLDPRQQSFVDGNLKKVKDLKENTTLKFVGKKIDGSLETEFQLSFEKLADGIISFSFASANPIRIDLEEIGAGSGFGTVSEREVERIFGKLASNINIKASFGF